MNIPESRLAEETELVLQTLVPKEQQSGCGSGGGGAAPHPSVLEGDGSGDRTSHTAGAAATTPEALQDVIKFINSDTFKSSLRATARYIYGQALHRNVPFPDPAYDTIYCIVAALFHESPQLAAVMMKRFKLLPYSAIKGQGGSGVDMTGLLTRFAKNNTIDLFVQRAQNANLMPKRATEFMAMQKGRSDNDDESSEDWSSDEDDDEDVAEPEVERLLTQQRQEAMSATRLRQEYEQRQQQEEERAIAAQTPAFSQSMPLGSVQQPPAPAGRSLPPHPSQGLPDFEEEAPGHPERERVRTEADLEEALNIRRNIFGQMPPTNDSMPELHHPQPDQNNSTNTATVEIANGPTYVMPSPMKEHLRQLSQAVVQEAPATDDFTTLPGEPTPVKQPLPLSEQATVVLSPSAAAAAARRAAALNDTDDYQVLGGDPTPVKEPPRQNTTSITTSASELFSQPQRYKTSSGSMHGWHQLQQSSQQQQHVDATVPPRMMSRPATGSAPSSSQPIARSQSRFVAAGATTPSGAGGMGRNSADAVIYVQYDFQALYPALFKDSDVFEMNDPTRSNRIRIPRPDLDRARGREGLDSWLQIILSPLLSILREGPDCVLKDSYSVLPLTINDVMVTDPRRSHPAPLTNAGQISNRATFLISPRPRVALTTLSSSRMRTTSMVEATFSTASINRDSNAGAKLSEKERFKLEAAEKEDEDQLRNLSERARHPSQRQPSMNIVSGVTPLQHRGGADTKPTVSSSVGGGARVSFAPNLETGGADDASPRPRGPVRKDATGSTAPKPPAPLPGGKIAVANAAAFDKVTTLPPGISHRATTQPSQSQQQLGGDTNTSDLTGLSFLQGTGPTAIDDEDKNILALLADHEQRSGLGQFSGGGGGGANAHSSRYGAAFTAAKQSDNQQNKQPKKKREKKRKVVVEGSGGTTSDAAAHKPKKKDRKKPEPRQPTADDAVESAAPAPEEGITEGAAAELFDVLFPETRAAEEDVTGEGADGEGGGPKRRGGKRKRKDNDGIEDGSGFYSGHWSMRSALSKLDELLGLRDEDEDADNGQHQSSGLGLSANNHTNAATHPAARSQHPLFALYHEQCSATSSLLDYSETGCATQQPITTSYLKRLLHEFSRQQEGQGPHDGSPMTLSGGGDQGDSLPEKRKRQEGSDDTNLAKIDAKENDGPAVAARSLLPEDLFVDLSCCYCGALEANADTASAGKHNTQTVESRTAFATELSAVLQRESLRNSRAAAKLKQKNATKGQDASDDIFSLLDDDHGDDGASKHRTLADVMDTHNERTKHLFEQQAAAHTTAMDAMQNGDVAEGGSGDAIVDVDAIEAASRKHQQFRGTHAADAPTTSFGGLADASGGMGLLTDCAEDVLVPYINASCGLYRCAQCRSLMHLCCMPIPVQAPVTAPFICSQCQLRTLYKASVMEESSRAAQRDTTTVGKNQHLHTHGGRNFPKGMTTVASPSHQSGHVGAAKDAPYVIDDEEDDPSSKPNTTDGVALQLFGETKGREQQQQQRGVENRSSPTTDRLSGGNGKLLFQDVAAEAEETLLNDLRHGAYSTKARRLDLLRSSIEPMSLQQKRNRNDNEDDGCSFELPTVRSRLEHAADHTSLLRSNVADHGSTLPLSATAVKSDEVCRAMTLTLGNLFSIGVDSL